MTPTATGRRESRGGADYLVLTRDFTAPIAEVWAAVTVPDRLERWIGTWTGNPARGSVQFRMTAEAEDAPEETFVIDTCDAPRLLEVTADRGPDQAAWNIELTLAETGGVTTLTFTQPMTTAEVASSVGPGWEYYLDRLVAAESGADVTSVVWDEYYPAQAEPYRALFS